MSSRRFLPTSDPRPHRRDTGGGTGRGGPRSLLSGHSRKPFSSSPPGSRRNAGSALICSVRVEINRQLSRLRRGRKSTRSGTHPHPLLPSAEYLEHRSKVTIAGERSGAASDWSRTALVLVETRVAIAVREASKPRLDRPTFPCRRQATRPLLLSPAHPVPSRRRRNIQLLLRLDATRQTQSRNSARARPEA